MLAVTRFRFQEIDQIDDIEEAAARAVADECAGNRDSQRALVCSRVADEDDVALIGDEVPVANSCTKDSLTGVSAKAEPIANIEDCHCTALPAFTNHG